MRFLPAKTQVGDKITARLYENGPEIKGVVRWVHPLRRFALCDFPVTKK